jgi:hypothetical protein
LERGARKTRMLERRFRYRWGEFESLRNRQSRRRRSHRGARHRDHRADGAEIIPVLIRIGILRRQLLLGGLYRRRCLRGEGMDVAERQHELHGDRKECDPCAQSDIRPKPLHAVDAPRRAGPPRWLRRYNITSQVLRLYVNR